MDYRFGPYHLDIDVQKTQAYYAQYDYYGCGCAGCNNFDHAVKHLPQDVHSFLEQFGVDPAKPAEIYAIHSVDGEETLYGGFFHICGKILSGNNPWIRINEKRKRFNEEYSIALSKGFSFYFSEDCMLLNKDFPSPVIQLEFTGNLPWVIDEPNPYI